MGNSIENTREMWIKTGKMSIMVMTIDRAYSLYSLQEGKNLDGAKGQPLPWRISSLGSLDWLSGVPFHRPVLVYAQAVDPDILGKVYIHRQFKKNQCVPMGTGIDIMSAIMSVSCTI